MFRTWSAIGAIGLLLAAAAAALVARQADAPDAASVASRRGAPVTRAEVSELRSAIEFERHAREALAQEVTELRSALAEARSRGPSAALQDASAASVVGDAQSSESQMVDPAEATSSGSEKPEGRFDAEALRHAGLADSDVERLRERWESFELDKLELNDRGLREGWKGRRFHQEHNRLKAALRAELGDEWDAYLFATGRDNRLRINNVLADSIASGSGFEEGDFIVSYGQERVYHPNELQGKAAACPDGGYVAVGVMRDGQPEAMRVPCGPLGVLVDHVKQPPLVQ